jgi:hypothetical protein
MPRTRPPAEPRNPADFVLRTRLREPLRFTDLSERLALKLWALPSYLARAHFEAWHRRVGAPDFSSLSGVFTPLVHVDLEVSDLALGTPSRHRAVLVRGQTQLAKTLDSHGKTRHLVREGHYEVTSGDGERVGRGRFVNAFTRYDPDPTRRRVLELPPELGVGAVPSRVVEIPEVDDLLPADRVHPDFEDAAPRFWHYTQTDANRHVNGMEYLRSMEDFVSCAVAGRGHDLRTLYPARARILYRKPCFRGEGYHRAAWHRGDAPLTVAGAFRKLGDPADAQPAVAIELTLATHAAPPA